MIAFADQHLDADHHRDQLPDIAESIASSFQYLHDHPDADRAEQLAARLNGVARFLMSWRAAILAEGGGA